LILAQLNLSRTPSMMDAPGLRFHALVGNRKGQWAVWVSAMATANSKRIDCSVSQVGAPAERGGASGSSCGLPSRQANNQASQKARK